MHKFVSWTAGSTDPKPHVVLHKCKLETLNFRTQSQQYRRLEILVELITVVKPLRVFRGDIHHIAVQPDHSIKKP
jgi:hypothetical protein